MASVNGKPIQGITITVAKAEIATVVDLIQDPLVPQNLSGDRPGDQALRHWHQKLLRAQQNLNKLNPTSSLSDQENAFRQIRQTFSENENHVTLEVDATTEAKVTSGTMEAVASLSILVSYGVIELWKWKSFRSLIR